MANKNMARDFIDLFTTIVFSIHKLSLKSLLVLFCLSSSAVAASPDTAKLAGEPTVEDNKVTVRINVRDKQNRPVVDLLDTDFQLLIDDEKIQFDSQDWRQPKDAVPPPAWIIVLLDMSGSMGEQDARGTTKLQGAVSAITRFKDTIANRVSDVPAENIPQIAIVPFGKPGKNCSGFPITKDSLNKFFPANAVLLSNHLGYLASETPCASTNLYEPLGEALRLLGNEADERFHLPEDSQDPTPRLSVILLSDGYHTEGSEAEDFEQLKLSIRQNPDIIIHTLGYGLSPEELGNKYGLGKPATRKDIDWSNDAGDPSNDAKTRSKGKVPAAEFVDAERLAEISQLTGGISEFSGDADTVADKLQVFLDALLGEYQISYVQPDAERGARYTIQAWISDNTTTVQTDLKTYIIPVFGRTLPGEIRASLFVGTLLTMGIAGVLPFWLWANRLKQEEV
jgi:hypothetical protein